MKNRGLWVALAVGAIALVYLDRTSADTPDDVVGATTELSIHHPADRPTGNVHQSRDQEPDMSSIVHRIAGIPRREGRRLP